MLNKELLEKICRLLRYDILTSTTAAGSGHPTSSLSAVELMATLFFGTASNAAGGFLRYDLYDPKNLANDRVIFSKGHSSPLLYSLYHAAGAISYEELLTLRKFDSTLEGHPTPRFKFVDVATGSLGQGLSVGVGMALGIKSRIKNSELRIKKEPRVFVLLGDSEMAEGQIWEALEIASYYKLNNLIGILDVNRLGQRGETMLGWNLEVYQKRVESFGWETIVVDDGHDLEKTYQAFKSVENSLNQLKSIENSKPTMIIAKTIKGKGVSFLENKEGWHGKALDDNQLKLALNDLGEVDINVRGTISKPAESVIRNSQFVNNSVSQNPDNKMLNVTSYKLNDLVSTREAYGDALVEIGRTNSKVVVLDAETSNSTYSEKFKKIYPDRFLEMFITEQNMISVALGLAKTGFVPLISSFAAFLSRGFDQMRMAQYSAPNIKIIGSHSGVSIGADGPSQMRLEDISMARSILDSIVFYPSDSVSTFKLVQLMANKKGIFYLRTTREKTPVLYKVDDKFEVGGSKLHNITIQNAKLKVGIITAGITLNEALKAQKELAKENIECTVVDCYSIKPLDVTTIQQLAASSNLLLVVEDHYPYGGLGEAVLSVLSTSPDVPSLNKEGKKGWFETYNFMHLSVNKIPRSGKPEELLNYEGIDSASIVKKIKDVI